MLGTPYRVATWAFRTSVLERMKPVSDCWKIQLRDTVAGTGLMILIELARGENTRRALLTVEIMIANFDKQFQGEAGGSLRKGRARPSHAAHIPLPRTPQSHLSARDPMGKLSQ